ncbi:MAG: aminotransferase class I/II-fold pyridoxal phosphate-dependent enzyme [Aminipila sp.]
MQAIILAAGMGKRLKELTDNNTKCMVEVNGITMIERALRQLDQLNLSKIIIVEGYEGKKLIEFIDNLNIKTPIVYVENDIYFKTNNIYSLYLAKDFLTKEDTILLESDLIFEDAVLQKLIKDPYPNLALIAKYESWMDGTVVTIDNENSITRFIPKKDFIFEEMHTYYKTVNIYKFSKEFAQTHYVPFLEAYCKALGNNEYYEQVLRVITMLDKPEIKAVVLDDELWYEIDDIQDLDIAQSIFSTGQNKVEKLHKRYGGYWRYPKLIDFCYLVNPYFPTQRMMDEIKANFEELVMNYPSGLRVNCLLAAKSSGLKEEYICVGNGAAEIIKELMGILEGKIGMIYPSFEEYSNKYDNGDIISYIPNNKNFAYTAYDLINFYDGKDIKALLVINPDNPTGNYISRVDMLKLLEWCDKNGTKLIIDESFIDFSDDEQEKSLLNIEILNKSINLIIIKSISKSFGVPGFRLGILASSDVEFVKKIKERLAIWNINSFAEFSMQIFEKYKNDYKAAINKFKETRTKFINRLCKIEGLRVIPSQANFVMCQLTNGMQSKEVVEKLLNKNILLKDLTGKKGINDNNYLRLAIRNEKDNECLISALENMIYDKNE